MVVVMMSPTKGDEWVKIVKYSIFIIIMHYETVLNYLR